MASTDLTINSAYSFKTLIICLFLIVATIAVYWQVQDHEFINFDDNEYITENQYVQQGITLETFKWAFTTYHSNNWHPLTWISHMLDVEIFGMNAGRHHMANVFFHIMNSLLLFIVFKNMTGSIWKSGFIAGLFALHPLHVESVAWASERKDVLSTFFWMLTLYGYHRFVTQPSLQRYVMVFLFFILGLLSKPMLVTLPFVLLLLDFWPLKRIQFDPPNKIQKNTVFPLLLEKIPLFLLVIISSFITFLAQNEGGVVKSLQLFPVSVRVANALIAYTGYMGKMIFPVNIAFLYAHPGSYPWWHIIAATLCLTLLTYFAIKNIKKQPYFIVGWLWFLGTLIPVIGLVQVGMQSMADRYTYVPLIGLFIIITWGISSLSKPFRYSKSLLSTAAICVLSVLMLITWKQVGYWENSLSMLEHTIHVTPKNYIAYDNMGVEYYHKGQIDKAIIYYKKSLQLKNDYAVAYNNLGGALYATGNPEKAVALFQEAVEINPDYYQAHNNIGLALMRLGNIEKAKKHFVNASEIKPDYASPYFNLGLAYNMQKKNDSAIKFYKRALIANPYYEEAQNNLCVAFLHNGEIQAAIDCFKSAFNKFPNDPTAKKNYEKSLQLQKK